MSISSQHPLPGVPFESTLFGYLPCSECGSLLSSEQRSRHACDPDESAAHQIVKARVQLTVFENEVARFLETSAGKFAVFLAQRKTVEMPPSEG